MRYTDDQIKAVANGTDNYSRIFAQEILEHRALETDIAFLKADNASLSAENESLKTQLECVVPAEATAKLETDSISAELSNIKLAIKEVVSQKADDVCWMDVYVQLGKLVGITIRAESLALLPKATFLHNCEHYIDCLKKGETYVTPTSGDV